MTCPNCLTEMHPAEGGEMVVGRDQWGQIRRRCCDDCYEEWLEECERDGEAA